MRRFHFYHIRKDLKRTFLLSLTLSLSVFAWLRIIFFDIPFSFPDDGLGLLKTIGIYWLLIFAVKTVLNLVLGIGELLQNGSFFKWALPKSRAAAAATMIALSVMLFSCNVPPSGIRKNFNTGMVTTYTGMVPAETTMIMNGEEINHTDIPLGEKFTIINKDIHGLVVKDNKVSVGCSLTISDTMGHQVFHEPDLFENNGVFAQDLAQNLKCQVNTGKPMEWGNIYAVKVVFWDKFGKGKIENTLNISTDDIP